MSLIAIDSHVHFHSASGAIEALSIANEKLAGNVGRIGVVMLAERQGFNVLDTLRSSLIATDEPEAFWFDESRSLLILAGRQIISAEKLEILALATTAILPDGLPAERIVAEMDAADAIVVLPWGVGKWIGKRGMLVDRLIAAARPGRLFLGDNSGRPGFWPVRQFNGALPVLSGSDPLPLPGWPQYVARLVSVIDADVSSETPATSLKAALRDPATQIERLGSLAGAVRFVTDQAKLRLYGGKAVP
ncbi:MAG: hypothetical protein AB7G25_09725 [Sphingomonadaceae bacterium]